MMTTKITHIIASECCPNYLTVEKVVVESAKHVLGSLSSRHSYVNKPLRRHPIISTEKYVSLTKMHVIEIYCKFEVPHRLECPVFQNPCVHFTLFVHTS